MRGQIETPGSRRRLSGLRWRWRALPLWLRSGLVAIVIVVLSAITFDVGSASPGLCARCHEMGARVASWQASAHHVVRCVDCHQDPTAWYEVPKRVADRASLLGRDVAAHFRGDFEDPVDTARPGAEPMPDAVCLSCHDPNRKATSGYRILIDHVEHAKRNGSCVSCHVRTAHRIESRGTALSLMGQCFVCHGTAEHPDASADCGTCHPPGYELVPQSHAQSGWAKGHGDVALTDEGLCSMCHAVAFCDDCHGLPMPHPSGWAKRDHAVAAQADVTSCQRCHSGGPDLCTMCHHTSYLPLQSPWIEQHSEEVKAEGPERCLTCHKRAYCTFCHTRLVEDGAVE